jgi:flavin reductase ActVB
LIDAAAFKSAMGSFPSGVVVATTVDAQGKRWGFTASAFSSVSLDPPLVLVCLAKSAESHATFRAAERMTINILRSGDEALAWRFATRGADKFAGDDFDTDSHGLPLLRDAVAAMSCRKFAGHDSGDHLVIIAQVDALRFNGEHNAMVHYRRDFWRFDGEDQLVPAAR